MSGEVHSHIGASSAHRWMNCPGSVALYDQLTCRRTSEYAAVGTAAHTICERCLREGKEPLSFLGQTIDVDGDMVEVTEDMVSATTIYVAQVRLDQHRHGGKLVVEQSFDLSWLHPGMFGRNDASLLPDQVFGTLRVYDYKNGRMPVAAENNPQLMYYALGALGEKNLMSVETVEMTIVQPHAIGKDVIDTWACPVEGVYDWAQKVLKPAAEATEAPDAKLAEGDWCVFCEAAAICPLRAKAALALLDPVTDDAPVATLPAVKALTPERLGLLSAFFQSEPFTSWVKSLAAEEQARLAAGEIIPGRKLVETTSLGNRRWTDEEAVTREFAELGGELLTTKLKSPAAVEKLLASRGVSKADRESRVNALTTRDETTKVSVVSEDDPKAGASRAIDLFD